jgi:hypothetical protein
MEQVKARHNQALNCLPANSREQFDEHLNGVTQALKPENRIVQIYADDFAYSSWQVGRYRRGLSTIIRMALPEIVYDILTRHLNAREPKEAMDLVERWSHGDLDARAQVSSILKTNGLEEQDIEAEAARRCLPELLRIEQLISSAASRRDKALAGIAFSREMSARQYQRLAKDDATNSRVVSLDHPRKKAR